MSIATLTPASLTAVPPATPSRINPLRALMDLWERDGSEDEDAGADVSVMISSLIGQQFFAADQD